MMRTMLPGFLLLTLCLVAGAADGPPATGLKLVATDPAPDALMGRNEHFFMRFEVKSPAPVTVSAVGWFQGKPVLENGGTGAPSRLAGDGSGVVSIFYWGEMPTKIDEVRLQIAAQGSGAPITEFAFPVSLTWLADEPQPRERARWVKDWQSASRPHGASVPTDAWPDDLWMTLAAAAIIIAVIGGILFDRSRAKRRAGDAAKGE